MVDIPRGPNYPEIKCATGSIDPKACADSMQTALDKQAQNKTVAAKKQWAGVKDTPTPHQ